jgi:GNAT superfamily N-acetyltransferase
VSGAALPGSAAPSWQVRPAWAEDVPEIAAAVGELLLELGGTPPDISALTAVTRAVLDEPEDGTLLVAEADGALVGVLAASMQTAIHAPGRYVLIQDLWVHPAWRSMAIGSALLVALLVVARTQQLECVEVGLPRSRFARLQDTEAFYTRNGFTPLGPRMRRVLT